MKIKEKILRKTTEFLIKEDCCKVTVDEIAAYNGISKRTLYELFLDKNDIIEQALLYCNEKTREYYHEVFSCHDDNIISVVLSGYHYRPDSKLTSAFRLFSDAKKYLPDIYENVEKVILEEHRGDLRKLLRKGQEDGLLLPDLQLDSLVTLLPMLIRVIGRVDYHAETPLSNKEIYYQTIIYYFRGISTEKGRMLIDDYLNKNKINNIV